MEEYKTDLCTPKEYMSHHPLGMNICYWMLVTMSETDLKATEDVMLEYAKHYHEQKMKALKQHYTQQPDKQTFGEWNLSNVVIN